MKNELILQLLNLLESLDGRLSAVEDALSNFSMYNEDFDFMSFGNEKQTIEEIRKMITESKERNGNES